MSPSKKANKQDSIKNNKSAQPVTKKTAVRSSRAKTKKTAQKSTTLKPTPFQPEAASTLNVQPPERSNTRVNTLRILALVVVIVITAYIISIRSHVEEFKQYGYLGVFFVALLANATVFIPAPGVAIIYAMGAVFNPLYVGLAAGTGGAIGELSGFLAGFSGQAIIEKTHIYDRIRPWVDKYGGWAILVLSAIPNPFFDVAGVIAGIAKMKMRTFLFSVWLGQLIKMTLFAYAGKYSIEWVSNLIK